MIDALRPYPATKASGVPWLESIAEHWTVQRLRNVAELRVSNIDKHTRDGELPIRLCNYVDVYKHDRIVSTLPFMSATATPEEINRFRLEVGDVLITKDSETWNDIGVPAFVAEAADDLVSGYHLALLRPYPERMDGAFLFWALRSSAVAYQFHVRANGVTRYGLSHGAIKSTWIPVPLISEQIAIARFLDYADMLIRRYIRAKQKLIKLLEEQKQAIIHRAVTCGLDPNVRMKPSGVEWLGDVPEHWEFTRLKDVANVQTGITLGKDYGVAPKRRYPYLRVANVQMGHLDLRVVKEIDVPESDARRSMLKIGDVLMTEGGDPDKLGRGCVWEGQIADCLHQNHVFAVRCGPRLLPKFLVAIMASFHGRNYFQMTAKQTTNLAATNSTTIREFPFFIPGAEEQKRILSCIETQTRTIDHTLCNTERVITLLQEYRTSLINEVVTGKRDVRRVASLIPDDPNPTHLYADIDSVTDSVDMAEVAEEVLEEIEV